MSPFNVGVGVVTGVAELVKVGALLVSGGRLGEGTDPPPEGGGVALVTGASDCALVEERDPPPEEEVGTAVVTGVAVLVTVVEFGEDVGEVTGSLELVASARVARIVVPIWQP